MKKNFFKKLSFVLALAMIVTALAPAAGAFAAKAPKLSASTKALFLDVENKNVYDFNISNKVTGWKYLWSSSNKKVATVNSKNGVTTAVKAGKAIISVVITDKDGEEFDTLKATVYVRDNIKELTIVGPADNKLAVDATFDFNRSYVTESKRTTGSEGKVAWSVLKDGKATTDATIDANGNFVAKVAGEYTIECRAFQSSAKRAEFLKDTTKTSLVTSNVATYKVTVAPSMTAAKQTNLVKFDLTFDSAMVKADIEKNLTVSYMAGTTKVKELVKGVTMSADNKTATVEMYLNFTKGATYVVEYTGMKSVEFVAATTKVADVTDIAILTTTAELSTEKVVEVALYNKDKVNLGADPDLAARVTLEKKDNNLVVLDGKKLYMYKVGDTVNVAATFHTYNWVDGKEVGNLTATQTITCVEQSKNQFGTLKAFTVGTSNPSNFNDPKHSFFKNTSSNLYVQLLGKKTDGTDLYTNNYNSAAGTWKYTSSNTSVVMVNPTSGSMYGANEGTAVIVVYLNDVQVGACEVTVTGSRKAATAALDSVAVTVSKDINETKTIGLKVKDQLNNDYTVGTSPVVKQYAATVKPAMENTNSKALINMLSTTPVSATNGVVLYPYGIEAGTYYYNIEITDNNNSGVKLYANLTVTVQESGTADIAYYKIESDKASYDLKDDSAVTLSVYGYTSGGVRKAKLTMAEVNTLEVKHSDGTAATVVGDTIALNAIDNSTYTVSGGSIITVKKLQATGTYTIKATSVSGSNIVSPVVFEVKNTRDKVVVTTNKLVAASTKTTVLDAINDCFDFAIGDNTGYNVDYYGVGASTDDNYGVKYKVEGKNVYIQYVYIYEPTGVAGQYYAHKVDMGGVVITMTN